MEKSYKTYQQVLNISVAKKTTKPTAKKVVKPKAAAKPTKKRTRTGCLTCRKRKKKCDEDKVNGKCQGCTRNFLECCWPEEPKVSALVSPSPVFPVVSTIDTGVTVKHPVLPDLQPVQDKCSISSLIEPPTPVKANPYPSPVHSPVSEVKKEVFDVKAFELPPSRVVQQPSKFIITSFNTDKDLCQVTAN